LEPVDDGGLELRAFEAVDLAEAGGGGDVDLRELIADDVEVDEREAAVATVGSDARADLTVACSEFGEAGDGAGVAGVAGTVLRWRSWRSLGGAWGCRDSPGPLTEFFQSADRLVLRARRVPSR
jgi:hypothetical protein